MPAGVANMVAQELKQRQVNVPAPVSVRSSGIDGEPGQREHPAGEVKHGGAAQILLMLSFTIYILVCSVTIFITQLIGVPLYWINRDLYYAYMALTKRSYGIVITLMTQWWSPTKIRVSGDASVAGQIRQTESGRLECQFPDRMILIANHQLYTDWLYLWWVAYTNAPRMHGHIYIIAKESLKWLPLVGWGMQFFGFIFMSRKFAKDKPRIAHRLQKLKGRHSGPLSGTAGFDPMWLLLFPEGTNASTNGRVKSAEWAKKIGIKDVDHTLLPRSTGSFFCLNELKGSLDYVYDCTMAYEGVPGGEFGQDYFTLTSSYFQGRPPKSVNLYWRRYAIKDIPLDDPEKFELWLRQRWYEKDALMEQYVSTGRFPRFDFVKGDLNEAVKNGFVETEVRPKYQWEIANVFVVPATLGLLSNILQKGWSSLMFSFSRTKVT